MLVERMIFYIMMIRGKNRSLKSWIYGHVSFFFFSPIIHLPAELVEHFYKFLFSTSLVLLFYLIFHYPLSCMHSHAEMEASFKRTRARARKRTYSLLSLFYPPSVLKKSWLNALLEQEEKNRERERETDTRRRSLLYAQKSMCVN
jgi:hypothetical protein